MPPYAFFENCVTLVAATGLTFGLYALGAGGWSALAMLLLLNLKSPAP